jgi:glucosylceramidase
VGTWEKFNVVDAGEGLVALQAQANGLYVSAWISDPNTPLEARTSSVNTWEKFQWCDVGNGSVALRAAADGLFVSAWSDVNTPLQARSTNANDWEIFQWGTPLASDRA